LSKAESVQSPDIRTGFRSLRNAERHLEEYSGGYARVRNHVRRVVANEETIQRLETAWANRPGASVEFQLLKEAIDRGEKLKQLAETEAFEAAASYKSFQKNIESAEKHYAAISRTLTADTPSLSETKDPEVDEPEIQPNGPAPSGRRQSRVMLAVLISQTLKEIDREM
jgi:hypothetical protein